jgi:hypothetical protein
MSPRILQRSLSLALLAVFSGVFVVFLVAQPPSMGKSAGTGTATPSTRTLTTSMGTTTTKTRPNSDGSTSVDTISTTDTTVATVTPTTASPTGHNTFELKDVYMEQAGTATFVGSPGSDAKDCNPPGIKPPPPPSLCFDIPVHPADYPDATQTLMLVPPTGDARQTAAPDPVFTLAQGRPATKVPSSLGYGTFLDALRGQPADVTVPAPAATTQGGTSGSQTQAAAASPTKYTGQILGVEAAASQSNAQGGGSGQSATPSGTQSGGKSYTLSLATANGIVSIALSSGTTVKLKDPRTAAQFQEALNELLRGNVLNDRIIRVGPIAATPAPVVRYSHPASGWQLQYRLLLSSADPTSATLSTLVTVRNTTALDWNLINLHIIGLRRHDPQGPDHSPYLPIPNVVLHKDEVGTFRARECTLKGLNRTLSYQNNQSSPYPNLEFALKGNVFPIAAPMTVIADVQLLAETTTGQPDNSGSVKLDAPYKLFTVQSTTSNTNPIQIRIANGHLTYVDQRTTELLFTNPYQLKDKVALKADTGWNFSPQPDPVTINGGFKTAATVVEISPRRHTALTLMSGDDVTKFKASLQLPAQKDVSDALQLLLNKQKEIADDVACLNVKRQALADALTAVAQRQTASTGTTTAALSGQLAHDDVAAAELQHKMDKIIACQAALKLQLELFARGLSAASTDAPATEPCDPCPIIP